MTSIARLEISFAQVMDLILADAEASAATVQGRTSEFWQDIFGDRSNFPTIEDFIVFRRGDFGYGMADERQGALEREREHATRTCEILRQSAPVSRIIELDESSFGAPMVFSQFGAARSAAFWTNAITALRIGDLNELHGKANAPLNVFEIGAGWGCAAHMLHQIVDISSYTIVDLPENLFLSTNYLAATHGLDLFPVTMSGPTHAQPHHGRLAFGLPGSLSVLQGNYDLIVNSFSLQEMDLDTVEVYFSWIRKSLAPDGMFVSFNSHGKAGVRKPSDYFLSGFRLVSLDMFRRYPTGFLNTIPYEMVLMPALESTRAVNSDLLDVICCLFQFGLGEDLKQISVAFVEGRLGDDIQASLLSLKGYFSSSPARREKALQEVALEPLGAVVAYLRAMDAFRRADDVRSKAQFLESIRLGLKGFAKLRACVHLSLIDGKKDIPLWNDDFKAVFAYPEIERMLENSDRGPVDVQFDRIVSVELSA